jgi:hypothetical protein
VVLVDRETLSEPIGLVLANMAPGRVKISHALFTEMDVLLGEVAA